MIRYGSVCSGIEAASAAWHPLGWQAKWFSEIEPFPCSVLSHHYPDVPNLGDMTKWENWLDDSIDVLVGGTPCQSFSIAGKRGGMDDHRGQLALSFSAIAKRYKPRWIVWENVPGVLSSGGGRDFGAFLGSLAELGYGCAYRVLDAQHFGVAQRRRRVFVVGNLGDWRRAAAVLFERKSLQRDSAKGGKARKGIAGTLSSRTTAGGGLGTDFDLAGGLQLVPPLTARMAKGRCTDGQDESAGYPHLICMAHGQGGAEIRENSSPTLTCNHEAPIIAGVQRSTPAWVECPEECGDFWCNIHEQHTGDCDCPPIDEWTTDPYGMQLEGPAFKVASCLPLKDPNDLCSLSDTRKQPAGWGQEGDLAFTLRTAAVPGVALAFAQNQLGKVRTGEVLNTISTSTNSNASGRNTPMVAFSSNMSEPNCQTDGTTPTLKLGGHGGGNPPAVAIRTANTSGEGNVPKVAFQQNSRNEVRYMNGDGQICGALAAQAGMNQQNYIAASMQVRRLTPIECERLQGFPDNYTNIPHRGKPAADGPRYKALGNSMAVPVMRWIGERIQMVEDLIHD